MNLAIFEHFYKLSRTDREADGQKDRETDRQTDRRTDSYFFLSLSTQEVLLMGHHGLLTAADSVALAFDLHYYFEQVLARDIGMSMRHT